MITKNIFLAASILFFTGSFAGLDFAPKDKSLPPLPPALAETPSLSGWQSTNTKPTAPQVIERRLGNTAAVIWTGKYDDCWSNPRNWKGGRVPGPSDIARLTTASERSVVVDASSTEGVAISDGPGTRPP